MRTFSSLNSFTGLLLCLHLLLSAQCGKPIVLIPVNPGTAKVTINENIPLEREAVYTRIFRHDNPVRIPEGCMLELTLIDYAPEKESYSYNDNTGNEVLYSTVPPQIKALVLLKKNNRIIKSHTVTASGNSSEELMKNLVNGIALIFVQ